jgi:short-subunit dehydrogenase
LPNRYGFWALIAGASAGLGAAFGRALAARGMNLVLVARRKNLLDSLAEEYRREFGVESLCIECDLGSPDSAERLSSAVSELDLGLVVYNAAYAPMGDFVSTDPADLLRVVDVNVRGPLALVRALLPPMVARRRGAVILMSSLAGNQGAPRLATYAASKAFNRVLAEGLWHELKEQGIDVVACCAGAVRTPGYASTADEDAPGTLNPDVVVEQTIRALGRGPVVVPGLVNQLAAWVMGRLLPRRAAVTIMANSTRDLKSAGTP